jgi:hypothetical protein
MTMLILVMNKNKIHNNNPTNKKPAPYGGFFYAPFITN